MSDWRALDPATLEQEYNARATVPDIAAELRAYRDASLPMYTALACRRDLAYGDAPDERLDLFPVPGCPAAPLLVFIHGGYWRALSRSDSVFMARNFVAHGVAVAALEYSLAPVARIGTMIDQCRRAVAWLRADLRTRGAGDARIVVAGSSAGAHLAAMVLAADAGESLRDAAGGLAGGVLVSGLYDLGPLRETLPQSWLKLSGEDVRTLSPQHHLPDPACPLQVIVAARDTREFKRQSRDYAQACVHQGSPVGFLEVAGRNHFNIILDWMQPDSALTRRTLALAYA